jgi:Tol biopolymer transport system component
MYDLVVRSVATGDEKIYTRDGLRDTPPKWLHDGRGILVDGGSGPPRGPKVLYLLDVKSREFKQILPEGSRSGITTLSPDDKTLYALSRDPDQRLDTLDRIVAFDLSAGTQRQVMPLESSNDSDFAFDLSPDGRMFAVAQLSGRKMPPWQANVTPPAGDAEQLLHLGVARIDGSDYHEISAPIKGVSIGFMQQGPGAKLADKLAWSKDGRAILFATATGNLWQIMRIGIDGGKPEYLGLTVKALNAFDLSPDGSRIAFSTTANGNPTSQLMAIDNLSSLLQSAK